MSRRIDPVPHEAAGALAALHRRCFPEDPWDRAALVAVMALPGSFGHVAWEGPGPEAAQAGFVLARDLGGECEILSLGVEPSRRRAGFGRLLLGAAAGEAELRGARSLVLEVAADNAAAHALYRALGFAPVGRRRHYYRRADGDVDALILRLALTAPAPSR